MNDVVDTNHLLSSESVRRYAVEKLHQLLTAKFNTRRRHVITDATSENQMQIFFKTILEPTYKIQETIFYVGLGLLSVNIMNIMKMYSCHVIYAKKV